MRRISAMAETLPLQKWNGETRLRKGIELQGGLQPSRVRAAISWIFRYLR